MSKGAVVAIVAVLIVLVIGLFVLYMVMHTKKKKIVASTESLNEALGQPN